MAIRSVAGTTTFTLLNTGRERATPPLVFSDFNPTAHFSFTIWAKVHASVGAELLFTYQGADGSQISVEHDTTSWVIRTRQGAVDFIPISFAPVTVGHWTLFAFVKDGATSSLYMGVENDVGDRIISLTKMNVGSLLHTFTFDRMLLYTTPYVSIANFKFWNTAFADPENTYAVLGIRWNAINNTPPPIWSSPLRTPGDLASIANPYAAIYWAENHEFSSITPSNSMSAFSFEADHKYMADTESCPTWIYLIPLIPFPNTLPKFNPGVSPIIPTTYKAPQFLKFHDRGSVPTTPFQTITYYAFPDSEGPTIPPSDYWGLFKDENGAEVSNTTNPVYKFTQADTAAEIPGLITSTNMYKWQYGAQFTYQPSVPPGLSTATGVLQFMHLFVTYIGIPIGRPVLPEIDMAGLFAINKGGKSVDRYNRGIELNIPNPTIRTAYIGE